MEQSINYSDIVATLSVSLPFLFTAIVALRLAPLMRGRPWTLLVAALTQTLAFCAVAEVLSLGNFLTSLGVRCAWTLLVIAVFPWNKGLRGLWPQRLNLGLPVLLRFYVAFYCLITGVVALLSPPGTIDSLTYHMARVAFWIQSQHCYHYTTPDLRQIAFPPLAELSIVNLQLLAGGDWPANLVQWQSSLMCLLLAYVLAQEFGLPCKAQAWSVVWLSTVPMFYLQSSSTQNDLVVGNWILATVYFSKRYLVSRCFADAAAIGSSLGCAALAKGTAFVILAPFVLLLTGYCIRHKDFSRLMIIAMIPFLLNARHWLQNMAFTGGPLGSKELLSETGSQLIDARLLLLGPLRQIALNMGIPCLEDDLTSLVVKVHEFLGINPNDRRITYKGPDFVVKGWLRIEDSVGSPTDVLVLCLGMVLFAGNSSLKRSKIFGYALIWTSSAVLFSLLLKWQPWATRLQLPLFCLAAPIAGHVLYMLPRWSRLILLAYRVLFIVFLACWNESRPLLSVSPKVSPLKDAHSVIFSDRFRRYFVACPADTMDGYVGAVRYLQERSVREAELCQVEYPYLLFVAKRGQQFPKLRYSAGSKLAAAFVISQPQGAEIRVAGQLFSRVWSSAALAVYERDATQGPSPNDPENGLTSD